MLKYLLIFALALGPCSSEFPKRLPIFPGPCPKIPPPQGVLQGDAYMWGHNFFFDVSLNTGKCTYGELDKNLTHPQNGGKILGTDRENFIVVYDCIPQKKGKQQGHAHFSVVFTMVAAPTTAVQNLIKKAYTDNGLDTKFLKHECK